MEKSDKIESYKNLKKMKKNPSVQNNGKIL